MSEVSLDEAGQTEDVLRRLINERKSLENGVAVLQAYRMIKTQLQGAITTLDEVKKAVEVERELFGNVQAERLAAMDKAEKEVAHYEQTRGAEASANVGKIEAKVTELQGVYDKMQAAYQSDMAVYTEEIRKAEEMRDKAQAELRELKEQHAALAEAIGKAAGVFSGSGL